MPIKLMLNDKLRGFTLIEVMIAMLVASVVLLALGSMLVMSIRTNQQSEHRMDAVAKTQSILSSIEANIAPNFIIGNATTLGSAQYVAYHQLCSPGNSGSQGTCPVGSAESIYTPTVALSPSPVPLSGLVTIAVTLAWQEHGVNKTVTLTSQVVI